MTGHGGARGAHEDGGVARKRTEERLRRDSGACTRIRTRVHTRICTRGHMRRHEGTRGWGGLAQKGAERWWRRNSGAYMRVCTRIHTRVCTSIRTRIRTRTCTTIRTRIRMMGTQGCRVGARRDQGAVAARRGGVVCACLARGICTTGVLHEGAGLALATNPRARDVGVYGKGWGQGGRVGHTPPPLLRAWKNKKSPLKPGNCPKSLSFEAPFGAAPRRSHGDGTPRPLRVPMTTGRAHSPPPPVAPSTSSLVHSMQMNAPARPISGRGGRRHGDQTQPYRQTGGGEKRKIDGAAARRVLPSGL